MKILIHDFAAFSFPVQLSRELARRGHEVLHLYSDFDPRGGRLEREPGDPPGFAAEAVSIGESFQKYDFKKRAIQEVRFARALGRRIRAFQPQAVFSANASGIISRWVVKAARGCGSYYIHWTQDIYSLAAEAVLSKRLGLPGRLMAGIVKRLEVAAIGAGDAVIVISEDFVKELSDLGITLRRVYTIPNWMPLDEMAPESKDNPWSRRHGLDRTLNIMYVGMLGFKHDADLFVSLAKHFASRSEVRIVAVGAGIVFDRLVEAKTAQGLDNLVLLGWQDYRDIAYVFATGDILMSLISPDASRFSVPCKVQSYVSAGRPVLGAIPEENLAHRLIVDEGVGLAVGASDTAGFLEAADRLVSSESLREEMSARGRAYAEIHFDIGRIADRFEGILEDIRTGTSIGPARSVRGGSDLGGSSA
jgi:colanic acid biosynthesis glycosyl transferase WcaI